MRVVSNSTPLIALSRIGKLDILHILFGSIIIPEAVFHEVVTEGASRPGANEVQNATWIDVQRVENAVAVLLRLLGDYYPAGGGGSVHGGRPRR